MQKSDFYYELPSCLIAQSPAPARDGSRMLVYNRKTDEMQHKHFSNLADYLVSGDVLVINKTRVIPARIFGYRAKNEPPQAGARVEFLLHKRKSDFEWETLARPAKRVKTGDVFYFSDDLSAEVTYCGEEGLRGLKFSFSGVFEEILATVGQMPLPHYIKQMPADISRYQTVYAQKDGSAAAPTAGLHFTQERIQLLKQKGVQFAEIVLHVGLGTFRPVKADNILHHKMHAEYYEVSAEAAELINAAKKEGRRVIAVGTTSVRTLESLADANGFIAPSTGETDIFIYPPYSFRVVDGLITNFHLPESTLIMLVSAFIGREKTLQIYQNAVENAYRFFSFGDACLFL
ncbi:MAG: tRNA preQ1(34) S-adenosylmethionine ribosyltransferase-isomerase QueA [Firmicutes bacterium]|nr:tRNA preQ1(34) S-adenosylmethionine ribosyltransferase-isomerase QueA [Bacillota bacterium]